jgi:hypothetical protein
MKFLSIIIKFVLRAFHLFWFVLMEAVIFSLIYREMINQEMVILANILAVIFITWLFIDIFLKVFVGTSKSIIRYIINI